MKDYLYYKQNNKEPYDSDTTILANTGKEALLLKCIQCRETYTNAYHCKEYSCPLYNLRTKWMKRPHTASDWFITNRNRIEDKWTSNI